MVAETQLDQTVFTGRLRTKERCKFNRVDGFNAIADRIDEWD